MKAIDLTGKRALVTGGSQGIGAEICKKLAGSGAGIMINHFKSKEKAEVLATELRETYSVKVEIADADVANSKEVANLFTLMDETFGGIDILVNNAGTESVTHLLDLEEAEWDRVIDINLKGPFLCSQQAGRRMEKIGGGVIINISSIHDFTPRKGLAHYCTSKAGLKMLSKCLSLELVDKNIRVVSIAPGAIETEMNREEIKKFGVEKFEKWIPAGYLGQASDVANSVVFLASDYASYIHGADIYIDGGYMNHTIQYDPRPPRKER